MIVTHKNKTMCSSTTVSTIKRCVNDQIRSVRIALLPKHGVGRLWSPCGVWGRTRTITYVRIMSHAKSRTKMALSGECLWVVT